MKLDEHLTIERIQSFTQRDRERVSALKRRHWASQLREGGPEEVLKISWMLYQHARAVLPSFPSPRERRRDLEHHIHLQGLMARVSHVFTDH